MKGNLSGVIGNSIHVQKLLVETVGRMIKKGIVGVDGLSGRWLHERMGKGYLDGNITQDSIFALGNNPL